jgi:hypothetical protein
MQVSAGASVHPSVYLNNQPLPAWRGAAAKASGVPATHRFGVEERNGTKIQTSQRSEDGAVEISWE